VLPAVAIRRAFCRRVRYLVYVLFVGSVVMRNAHQVATDATSNDERRLDGSVLRAQNERHGSRG
jgi:hypothetical protein